jgi:hypothetical protein
VPPGVRERRTCAVWGGTVVRDLLPAADVDSVRSPNRRGLAKKSTTRATSPRISEWKALQHLVALSPRNAQGACGFLLCLSHSRVREPRGHAVHVDPKGRPFAGQSPSQPDVAHLGCSVVRLADVSVDGCRREEIDDLPVVPHLAGFFDLGLGRIPKIGGRRSDTSKRSPRFTSTTLSYLHHSACESCDPSDSCIVTRMSIRPNAETATDIRDST